jgi:glycosyltransferase involved in cell wall biosynthesis
MLFYPSKQEGFGLAGVEAASFGVPLLALAGTVTEELFPDGTGAVIAKDLSRDRIAEAAIPVLRSTKHAAQLGRSASVRVNAVFLEEHFAKRLLQALAPLLPVYGAVATDVALGELRRGVASSHLTSTENRQSTQT